jgi:hypothetical protein
MVGSGATFYFTLPVPGVVHRHIRFARSASGLTVLPSLTLTRMSFPPATYRSRAGDVEIATSSPLHA